MDSHPFLKTPKLEPKLEKIDDDVTPLSITSKEVDEEEEALVAMIAHRQHELDHNKQRAAHFKAQVEVSERRLRESQAKLTRLRSMRRSVNGGAVATAAAAPPAIAIASTSAPPTARTQIVIPAPNPKTPAIAPLRAKPNPRIEERPKRDLPLVLPASKPQEKKPRRAPPEQREHQEVVPSVRKSISPRLLSFQAGTHISSQHKRKLRCLVLSPASDQIFATSALDGVVNLWQVQGRGHGASLLSSTDCMSPKQRRWPEDIAWHPDGDSLFAVYTADSGDSQISIMDLNQSGDKKVVFLSERPHFKGIINSISFMPWVDPTFATGGSDHAVILWQEKDDTWKSKTLHRDMHSSAVMGVAGLQQKKVILSVGADKRIIGYDLLSGRADFKHQIESKCMSVLPNPSDFNLFMVQTGTPGKQLRLFDIRRRQTEIHAFGWKQESSESQSALINQTWSPDGIYLSSGSADPMIHIFDIRYSGSTPAQSVQAHQKRVFKAIWHQSLPLLTSISSDLNIGLHRIV